MSILQKLIGFSANLSNYYSKRFNVNSSSPKGYKPPKVLNI